MDKQGTVALISGEVAEWHVCKRVLYVRHGDIERSTEVGGFGIYPQALASILLSEMVLDAEHAPDHQH